MKRTAPPSVHMSSENSPDCGALESSRFRLVVRARRDLIELRVVCTTHWHGAGLYTLATSRRRGTGRPRADVHHKQSVHRLTTSSSRTMYPPARRTHIRANHFRQPCAARRLPPGARPRHRNLGRNSPTQFYEMHPAAPENILEKEARQRPRAANIAEDHTSLHCGLTRTQHPFEGAGPHSQHQDRGSQS
jgi:hypothetical protein